MRPNSRTYTTTTPVNIVYAVPERSDLFYHVRFIVTPTSHEQAVFAFSFLDVPPPDVDSPVVIGCLPAQSYITENPEEQDTPGDELTLEDFVPNPNFVEVLHDTVKHVLKEGLDEFWESGARKFQAGWMHIYDQRKTSDLGHVGSPDDIIGTVLVEDGKIKAETYQPMSSYRVCTSDGILQLTPGFAKHFRKTLLEYTKDSQDQWRELDDESNIVIKQVE